MDLMNDVCGPECVLSVLVTRMSRNDTGGMLGHVFGHQASRTRPLEAARAACSTSIAYQYHQKSMKTFENHRKSMKINENYKNQWKFMVFTDFVWQCMVEQAVRATSRAASAIPQWPNTWARFWIWVRNSMAEVKKWFQTDSTWIPHSLCRLCLQYR